MKKANRIFTDAEQQRIKAAVKEAERATSGEIVPMVVDQSYDYPRAELIGGVSLALATAIFLSWLFGGESIWVFLPLFIAGVFLFKALINRLPNLKRRLIHPDEITAEVEEKALVSFLEQGLHHTRDKTGILILVSLFEHRVRVLADKGINDKVAHETWDEIVTIITTGLKSGDACSSICLAVTRCGELLQEHFPIKADDTNELPNLILEGKDQ